MTDVVARQILCPKQEDHIHKKILFVLGDDYIGVHCGEHRWLKEEFFNGSEKIDYKDVRVKISSFKPNTNFILSPVPGVAIGEFKSKRK